MLNRGAPLRRTAMPRTAAVPTRGGAFKHTQAGKRKRVRDTGPGDTVRKMVDGRAGGWCEWPGCSERGTQRHHRLGRKAGGRHGQASDLLNGAAWLLKVCHAHHAMVTSPHGEALGAARASGWLLMEGQNAEAVPVVVRWWVAPVLLDAYGGWTAVGG
jgi:hypothetical protein